MGRHLKLWVIAASLFLKIDFVIASSQSDSLENIDLVNFFRSDTGMADSETPQSAAPIQTKVRPLGEIKGPTPPECHPRNLENNLVNRGMKAKDFSYLSEEYFKKCEKYWHGPEKSGRMAMLEFISASYDLNQNKEIQYTTLSMRGGIKVKAFIAMHDGFTRRPWVIAKCGVFCTAAESTSVQNYLMNLFDQSPFNVIFLSNRTGVDFIMDNESLTLGGYLEAHDYYEIGRWLKEESPYKDTVDSLHALGMSLAGSAAIFVEPLADAYGYTEENRLYQSVMSLCAVVNLQPTITDMYTNKSKRNLFTKLTWDELQQVKSALHEVEELVNQRRRPDYSEFPDLMAAIVLHYGSQWGKGQYTFRKTKEIQTVDDLWELNQFSNLQKEIKAPVLVWASKDDSIVSNAINTGTIPNSWVFQNSPNLGVLNVNYGGHCAFATSYGYPVTSALMRSFVLSHSKKFLDSRKLSKVPFDFNFIKIGLDKHLRQWWQAYPNRDYATINFQTHNEKMAPLCSFTDIYGPKAAECRKLIKVKVPLSILKDFSITVPTNNTEAEVLSRKLNGLLRVTSEGKALEGTTLRPSHFEWYDYSL
jgi:predicted alpha/beta-fold hydrolase